MLVLSGIHTNKYNHSPNFNLYIHSIVMDASSISFQYYTDGIYHDTDCNQSGLNHALLVVGYGTDTNTGIDYWILKNRCGNNQLVQLSQHF